MTRGVLIFAQNNAEIDYAKISLFSAKRVKEYLGVPVSLVTDSAGWLKQSQPDAEQVFDQIIEIWTETHQTKKFYDGSLAVKTLTWKNLSRVDCCFLSPYDETLVIDSDFIISSPTLKNIWDNQNDFLIYKDSFDLANWRDDRSFRYLNQHSIPFYWATAFYFKKTAATWAFFDLIKNIKLNWNYYRLLYNIDSTVFRNDFAFSIAIHMMGEDFATPLPGKMNYILDRDILLDIDNSKLTFLVERKNFNGEYTAVKTSNLDVHVMNKYSLTRCIDGVVNE
jgi:hypothetical protein